jgi:hypothetical protein
VGLGDLDELLGAQLRAHRREDRVAGLGEDLGERPAAGLAVGVLELHALQRREGLDRVRARELRQPLLQTAGHGDDLHRRTGGLQAGEGDAGEREELAGPRLDRHDAAEAAAQGLDGGALDRDGDRGPHRVGGLRLRPRQHDVAGAERPAGTARELLVQRPLETGEPDLGVGRPAQAPQLGGALGRRLAHPADDVDRDVRDVRGPVRAGGQRRVVAREQVGPLGQPGLAAQLGPGRESGERVLPAPGDARLLALTGDREGHRPPDGAEDPGPHHDRHDVGVLVLLHRAGAQRDGGRGTARGPVGLGELLAGEAVARLRADVAVHRVVVAPAPGLGEPLDEDPLLRHVPGADDEAPAERQGPGREDDDRDGPAAARRRAHGRRGGRARRDTPRGRTSRVLTGPSVPIAHCARENRPHGGLHDTGAPPRSVRLRRA